MSLNPARLPAKARPSWLTPTPAEGSVQRATAKDGRRRTQGAGGAAIAVQSPLAPLRFLILSSPASVDFASSP